MASQRARTAELPASLRELADGARLAHKADQALSLITVDDDGWPHTALLSVGEILATSATTLRVALWPSTSTRMNLDMRGRALLVHVADGVGYYIRLSARPLSGIELEGGRLAAYELTSVDVLVDAIGYAELVSGITYELKQPAKVYRRWEQTLHALDPGADR